ncbi:hypothetical protein Trydic_g10896 [Trypoxylus dichotomus]
MVSGRKLKQINVRERNISIQSKGVHMERNLGWKTHISETTKKVNRILESEGRMSAVGDSLVSRSSLDCYTEHLSGTMQRRIHRAKCQNVQGKLADHRKISSLRIFSILRIVLRSPSLIQFFLFINSEANIC